MSARARLGKSGRAQWPRLGSPARPHAVEPAFVDNATHVYDVVNYGDATDTRRVHVACMRPYSAKLEGASATTETQLREAARLDVQNGFAVEAIIGHQVREGRLFLQVQWLGFPVEQSSFEPIENLTGCEAYVLEYCTEHADEHALLAEQRDALKEKRAALRAERAKRARGARSTSATSPTP